MEPDYTDLGNILYVATIQAICTFANITILPVIVKRGI